MIMMPEMKGEENAKDWIKNKLSDLSLDHLLNHNSLSKYYNNYPKTKCASVLVPLFIQDSELFILLTVRSTLVKDFKSEVAFPGGKAEASDENFIETALREAEEEIGLSRDQVEVVMSILPLVTRNSLLVTPVIGLIPSNFVPKPNPEVDFVFTLPLNRFVQSANSYNEEYEIPGLNMSMTIHFFKDVIDGKSLTTWGMTAGILYSIAFYIYGGSDITKIPKSKEEVFQMLEYFLKVKSKL